MNNSETGPILTCKRKCTSRGLSPLCYDNCTKFQLPLLLPHTTRQTTKPELMRSIVKKKTKPIPDLRSGKHAKVPAAHHLACFQIKAREWIQQQQSWMPGPRCNPFLTLENLCINRDRERHVNLSVQVIPVRRTFLHLHGSNFRVTTDIERQYWKSSKRSG